MDTDLNFKCKVTLNNKYKKVLSENVLLKNNEYADFDFSVYDNEECLPAFSISIQFEKDDTNLTRIEYDINDHNNVLITVYNIVPNPNNQYTICFNNKEIAEINDKKYFIEPKIIVYSNLFKEVTIDLYEEIK
jgi:hypothetical protein